MKKTLLSLACLALFLISYSQGYDPEKINKKAVAIYNQALEKAQGGNYKDAINLLYKVFTQTVNILMPIFLSPVYMGKQKITQTVLPGMKKHLHRTAIIRLNINCLIL